MKGLIVFILLCLYPSMRKGCKRLYKDIRTAVQGILLLSAWMMGKVVCLFNKVFKRKVKVG